MLKAKLKNKGKNMKKLLMIALIGLFNLPNYGINQSYVNGKYYTCDGDMFVRNGEAWCNGKKIDATNTSWSFWPSGNYTGIQGSGKSETKQIPIKNIKKIA